MKMVALPSSIILISSVVLPILLLFTGAGWASLWLFPAGVVLFFLYTNFAGSRWKMWAYSHVADIHQLQRSAEIAKLLAPGSHERTGSLIDVRQEGMLEELQDRFDEEHYFIDDPSVPAETPIYRNYHFSKPKTPEVTLTEGGIHVHGDGFIEWSDIVNERVASASYSRTNPATGEGGGGGSANAFRFECSAGRFDTPLASLNIEAWELDLLLYIYRGRFEMTQRM